MTAPYQNALITGASSGLGLGLATWFAKKGVKVYAAARRLDRLEALAKELGPNVVPVQLDVAKADAAHERITALDQESGGFDLVIANAGVGGSSSGKHIVWESERHMAEVNVLGALATLCAVLPGMNERKKGHLVGVSSLAGLLPLKASATYCASKAFLAMWLDSIRLDVEPVGLDVTCLHPGFVKSEMTAKNKRRMPMIMETEPAVELMGQAIVRREKRYAFPWQLASVVHSVAQLPKGLQHAAIKRLL